LHKIIHFTYTPGFYRFHINFPKKPIEVRASQISVGDFIGLPTFGEDGQTEWILPEWLQSAIDEPQILVFDEYGRALQEVKDEIEKLPKIVHKDTLIFAATSNGDSSHFVPVRIRDQD
jgi:hypothetical protein